MAFVAARRAVTFVFAALTAFAQNSRSGTISGYVLNAASNAPIAKATVTLMLDGPANSSAVAISDARGGFTFRNLPPGQYRITAAKDGFWPLAFGTRSVSQAGTYVKLADAEARSDIVFRLPAFASVSGVVTDSDGEPLAMTQVDLLRSGYQRGKPTLTPGGGASTDDRGVYRISRIPPGRYYLRAQHIGRGMHLDQAMNQNPEPVTLPTFFPSAVSETQARRFELRSSEELSGVDIRLLSALPGSIKGRVVLPEGQTNQNAHIIVASEGLRSMNSMGFGLGPNGEIPEMRLPPGEYVLTAMFETTEAKYSASIRVNVHSGRTEEVTLTPKPLLEIPCVVKVEGLGAEKYKEFRISLTPPTPIFNRNAPPPQTTWKQGTPCKFTNVQPGIWDINIALTSREIYIKAMTLGGQDVLNEEMNLQDSPGDPLTIVLSTAAAEVSGEVEENADGKVMPSIVLLAPAVHQLATLSLYRTAYTDADGKFQFRGLAPGNYRVFAFEELEQGAWEEPDFLKPFAASAAPLRLAEGQKAAVHLRRIPAAEGER